MLQKNNILAVALCAGLMSSLAFGSDAAEEAPFAPAGDAPTETTSPTVDSTIGEDVAYYVEKVRPYATLQNGVIAGSAIFGLGLVTKAFELSFVPAIKKDMNVLDFAQAINARTSTVIKVGLFGGLCAAGLSSYAFIRESLKPREEGDSENKRQYQAMAGISLGAASLGLAAKWFGYGVAKLK